MDADSAMSHQRKVRCSGTKPCCENCLRQNDNCHWKGLGDEQDQILSPRGIEDLVSVEQRRVLLDIFFKTPHLDIIRQSIHRLSFESTQISQQSEFLLASIYCLSALYVSESDTREVFHGEPARALSQRLANVAQKYSRDTSDQPSGSILSLVKYCLKINVTSPINSGKPSAWIPRATLSDRV